MFAGGHQTILSISTSLFRIRSISHNSIMSTAIMAAAPKEQPIQTAPFDPRFPNQNQTKYCYQSFLDFHRCQKVKGTDYEPCNYFKRVYRSMCPNEWVDKWEGQIEEGTFAGRI